MEFLSPAKDEFSKSRGGSRISGKGVRMYKGVGVRFADFISFFLNIPRYLTDTKLFHFHGIFKNGGQGGCSNEPPEPPLDLPLEAYLT